MLRLVIILTVIFSSGSCSPDSVPGSIHMAESPQKRNTISAYSIPQDTSSVKNWLIKVILDYTTNNDLKIAYKNMRSALTDNYYHYKQDAINLEYDTAMTEEQFHQKWKKRYDTKFVGRSGFFISTQDNGKIVIPVCVFLNSIGDSAQVYHVVIRDPDFQTEFIRDITVIRRDKQFFIDNVKEYE